MVLFSQITYMHGYLSHYSSIRSYITYLYLSISSRSELMSTKDKLKEQWTLVANEVSDTCRLGDQHSAATGRGQSTVTSFFLPVNRRSWVMLFRGPRNSYTHVRSPSSNFFVSLQDNIQTIVCRIIFRCYDIHMMIKEA